MGVLDGQAVSASITNAAFLDKNEDATGIGIYTFANTDVSSGPTVANVQRAINRLFDGTGIDNVSTDGTQYNAPSGTINNGDSHFVALRELANLFSGATGHIHDGTDGNGPVVQIAPAMTGSAGQVFLASTAPDPIAAVGSAGSPDGVVANSDHTHEGLHSIAATGQTAILGDAILVPGMGVQLSQAGQNITIAASGAAAGVSSVAVTGNPAITGNVVFVGGTGVSLSEAGQNITISASGTGLRSLSVTGQPQITGDAVLIAGSNIGLVESGNNITISASGSPGAGTLVWYPSPSGSPDDIVSSAQNSYLPLYDFTIDELSASPLVVAWKGVVANFVVPSTYIAGSQLFLKGTNLFLDASATDNILMKASTAVIRTTNTSGPFTLGTEHISTNTQLTLSGIPPDTALQTINTIDLTDVTGGIASIAVAAGDVLRIHLYRDYLNESTPCGANIYMFKNTNVVST